jgi:iron complex outermembrane recepter protein
LPFSPTFKANVQGVYTVRLANSNKLEFESDYTYQTKEQFSLTETPDTVQPAYGIWNASVAFATPANGWKLTGFVKNITDRYYALVIAQGTNARWRNVPRDNGRYFGVALRKDF